MYRITFNLRTPKSKRDSLIFLIVFLKGIRIKISTRQRINPALWNFKQRKVTKSKVKIESWKKNNIGIDEQLNNIQHSLDLIRKETDMFFLERNLKGFDPNLYDFKDHMDRYLNPSKQTLFFNDFVIDYLNVFINEASEGLRKQTNGNNYAKGTLINYRNLRFALELFEKESGYKLRWDMINRLWYFSFLKWHEDKRYSKNYIGKHIKDLKSLMRCSFEEGIHKNEDYRKRYFAKPKDSKKKVPLTLKEVNLLFDVDLPPVSQLDLARDVFLIGCFMGLRISDIKQISPDKITENENGKCLSLKQKKTNDFVMVPINSRADRILKKYDYTLFKVCEQVVNRNIKKVAVVAGIDEGKAKKLSIHISRHTFARLSYQFGIPVYHVMKITGHRSEKSFLRYINILPDQAVEEFRKHIFFKVVSSKVCKS